MYKINCHLKNRENSIKETGLIDYIETQVIWIIIAVIIITNLKILVIWYKWRKFKRHKYISDNIFRLNELVLWVPLLKILLSILRVDRVNLQIWGNWSMGIQIKEIRIIKIRIINCLRK